VLHLLYSRFWHKVLFDLGLVHTKEPFQRLVNQGMILGYSYRYWDDNVADEPDAKAKPYGLPDVTIRGESAVAADGTELKERWVPLAAVRHGSDGKPLHPGHPEVELEEVVEKMSKSRGNVINPDEVVSEFGADAMRLYEMFIGPLEKDAPWSTEGIHGIHRFLQRAHRLVCDDADGDPPRPLADGAGTEEQARLTARTIDGVTEDLEAMRFNTAISKLMVFARDIAKDAPLPRDAARAFVLMLSPMAPHLGEELWRKLGHEDTLAYEPWPEADPSLLVEDTVSLVVQVNGKRRDEIQIPADASKEAIEQAALASEKVRKHLDGRDPKKVIVVPGRLVNVVG
jgi:leucyl-tRNA synthetase